MIQVLGLRDFTANGRTQKREVFFNKNYRFAQAQDVFDPKKLTALLESVPLDQQWNLYWTVADCFEERTPGEKGRKLKEQWVIPFDIDALEIPSEDQALEVAWKAAEAACEALNVNPREVGVIFSGHGVQLFVLTTKPIISEDYFDATRESYATLCKAIQLKLTEKMIPGKADPSVWSAARLMRLPMTENRKPNKPIRTATILSGHLVPMDFDIVERSGVTTAQKPEFVPDEVLKNYPKPDTKAVCEGCKFLVHCKTSPAKVTEPEWYAMNSITARLDDGATLTHEYSAGHPGYNHYETELKIAQALASSGPRTCKNIDTLWAGCHTCEYYGKIVSPIMIKGPDYIASVDFGFRTRRVTENGGVKPGLPVYTDLIKFFATEHPFKTLADSDTTYIFNGKYWEPMPEPYLKQWATDKIRPEPSATEMREFIGQLRSYNVVNMKWFNTTRDRHLNFNNCVLNIETMETHPHDPQYGFFSVLPFDYDPKATAPRWERFLLEVMGGDAELAELLKEFGGYCISGDDCWAQKALILLGDGANGKSVYMNILSEVVGADAFSAISMQALQSAQSRHMLLNKSFNYSEETSVKALAESDIFKLLADGGMMEVKQLYVQPFNVANRAKLVISANNMPHSSDKSHAVYRRMFIVQFNVRFTPGVAGHDYNIKDKLRAELPGICNSLIAAYRKVKQSRVFSAMEKTNQTIMEYQLESDNVARFWADHVSPSERVDGYELCSEVYQQYKNYCEFSEEKPLSAVAFGKQVARLFNKHSFSTTVNKEAKRVYKEIKLRKEF